LSFATNIEVDILGSQKAIRRILDLARWAPSGDNEQPWRFEIVEPQKIRVHGFDTRDRVLYDYQGWASQIAHGALLETIRIAASGFGMASRWSILSQGDDRHPVYEVQLTDDPTVIKDPLFSCIENRTVQRRPMKTTPLTQTQRQALIDAVGDKFDLQLFESTSERFRIARMLWRSAHIRLTCPEAYPVHKSAIEWRARFSKDRIPGGAVGVDPLTARLMEWVLQSWTRVRFFNRFLFGTIAPRLQLDFLPGLFCAAHLLIKPKAKPVGLEGRLHLGAAWQRLWLTATQQGLHLQPQMTPVIFRWYARAGQRFSAEPRLFDEALQLSGEFEALTHANAEDNFGVFARVGRSSLPGSRSIRKDLADLMKA
jgi:hypothetical protein